MRASEAPRWWRFANVGKHRWSYIWDYRPMALEPGQSVVLKLSDSQIENAWGEDGVKISEVRPDELAKGGWRIYGCMRIRPGRTEGEMLRIWAEYAELPPRRGGIELCLLDAPVRDEDLNDRMLELAKRHKLGRFTEML